MEAKSTDIVGNASAKTKAVMTDTMVFLKSGGILANIAFVALLILALYILMKLSTKIATALYQNKEKIYLYKNLKYANESKTLVQDPKDEHSVLVRRSTNRKDGIEYTYSCWIYVNQMEQSDDDKIFKPVFVKANNEKYVTDTCDINVSGTERVNNSDIKGGVLCDLHEHKYSPFKNRDFRGINYPSNGPGVYLFSDNTKDNSVSTLNLLVLVNTYSKITEHVIIPDISLQKWINVIVRIDGKYLDVYINGTIRQRKKLNSLPKQNYGSVFINGNHGFDGKLSGLKYFNKAIDIFEINNIVKKGPYMEVDKSLLVKPPYYSSDWYYDDNIDTNTGATV